MIEAILLATAVVLLAGSTYVLGYRLGRKSTEQYFEAAKAVQEITNVSVDAFARMVDNDSRRALENLVTVSQAVETRLGILGRQVEAQTREIATLTNDESPDASLRQGTRETQY